MTQESLTWLAISDTPCRVSWHKSILRFSQVLNPSGCSKSFFKRTFQHSTGLQKCISKSEGEKRWVIQETFFSSVLTFFSPEFYFGSRKPVETSFHFVGVKFQKKTMKIFQKSHLSSLDFFLSLFILRFDPESLRWFQFWFLERRRRRWVVRRRRRRRCRQRGLRWICGFDEGAKWMHPTYAQVPSKVAQLVRWD